jgi:predicted cupin superfamily sugar epimerase
MEWQQQLGLEPHPEGGYFRRIYAAEAVVQTAHGSRQAASSIHYLLTRSAPSARFHRVRSTILHYLQAGGPVQYASISKDGHFTQTTLGFGAGQLLFLEVPPNTWKASRLLPEAAEALVSEVVIPGFDWADHEYLHARQLAPPLLEQLHAAGWLPMLSTP